MNRFLLSGLSILLVSAAVVPTVKAETIVKATSSSNSPLLSTHQREFQPISIAEGSRPISSEELEEQRLSKEMLRHLFEMTTLSPLLESPNPEIRKMAQETPTQSNATIEKMMTMRKATFSSLVNRTRRDTLGQ